MQEKKIALIGMDTSHTVCFTKLIQGTAPDGGRIDEMRVKKAMRFPTVFLRRKKGKTSCKLSLRALALK